MSLKSALSHLKFWEPEESVGHIWDEMARGFDATPHFPEAAVRLADAQGALIVFFRGLGGGGAVEIKAGAEIAAHYRRSLRRKLGHATEMIKTARFDGVSLTLPETIDETPNPRLNRAYYLWLAALAAIAEPAPPAPADPLQADVARLVHAHDLAERAVATFPGLRTLRDELYRAAAAARPRTKTPQVETEIEDWIRARLAGAPLEQGSSLERALAGDAEALGGLIAPAGYRSYRPLLLWGEYAPTAAPGPRRDEEDGEPGSGGQEGDARKRKAERRQSDQADRRDSLLLHRFESILSIAEFLNINRQVQDDDPDGARKAADDVDTIGVVKHHKKPQTLMKLDLDLSPADADRERIADKFTYPEWDWRTKTLQPDWARVLETRSTGEGPPLKLDAEARRRIERVRRRFESLRPRRRLLSRQIAGDELDLDEVVRARADWRACGMGSERLYRAARNEERDLAVAVLMDVSRSTESAVHGRSVISIAREALVALARGLDACGDRVGLFAFSSLRRDRVFVDICKGFDEPFGAGVDARIAALKPGFYTRLGAAIRHVSFRLDDQDATRKLLLVITDGKPNDLDHYEGRFGLEDTRHAVQEARRAGQAVFAIAIDAAARTQLPFLFGRAGYAVTAEPEHLTEALPGIWRHIVA